MTFFCRKRTENVYHICLREKTCSVFEGNLNGFMTDFCKDNYIKWTETSPFLEILLNTIL